MNVELIDYAAVTGPLCILAGTLGMGGAGLALWYWMRGEDEMGQRVSDLRARKGSGRGGRGGRRGRRGAGARLARWVTGRRRRELLVCERYGVTVAWRGKR